MLGVMSINIVGFQSKMDRIISFEDSSIVKLSDNISQSNLDVLRACRLLFDKPAYIFDCDYDFSICADTGEFSVSVAYSPDSGYTCSILHTNSVKESNLSVDEVRTFLDYNDIEVKVFSNVEEDIECLVQDIKEASEYDWDFRVIYTEFESNTSDDT